MAGRPTKEFHEYLISAPGNTHVNHSEYIQEPATAFLRYVVEAKSSVDMCLRKFKASGDYAPDANDSIRHIIIAMLPAIMGHYETYQRYLFAGMFEYSVFLNNFKADTFFKKISDCASVEIDLVRLASYRSSIGFSAGVIIADSLPGWHSPEKVNKYFAAFGLNRQFYGNSEIRRLRTLWQLRHSIVHTGGTITVPDAQKASELAAASGKTIAFENNFIYEVARKIHPLIKASTEGIGGAFKQQLKPKIEQSINTKIDELFKVRSSVNVWLR